jgi:hypothetical protein
VLLALRRFESFLSINCSNGSQRWILFWCHHAASGKGSGQGGLETNMPHTLYRVIGTMEVSGNQAGVGQSINYSFDLDYANAQQNGGLPQIVGSPIVTSFGPLGQFEIQGTGVELDNLVRFRSPVAEIELIFQALK